jgi:hypothetical protein
MAEAGTKRTTPVQRRLLGMEKGQETMLQHCVLHSKLPSSTKHCSLNAFKAAVNTVSDHQTT